MAVEYDMQVGAIGFVFRLTVRDEDGQLVDLTNAETIKVFLRGPVGPRIERAGVAEAPATGGVVRYTTVAGDIQHHGVNKAQCRVTFTGGSEFWSEVAEFEVGPNL